MIASWPCPTPGGGTADEYAVMFPVPGAPCVLVIPALFDEGNRMRRLTVETMRCLAAAGIASVLPDLPGANESLQPLGMVALADWRAAMAAAAAHFGASHVLTVRGGALIAPALPGLSYAPVGGAAILRQLLRARILAAREAGREETQERLLDRGRRDGLDLAGYPLSAAMIAELERAEVPVGVPMLSQADIGGGALWLRAEPDHDPAQAQALCSAVAMALQIGAGQI